MRFGLMPYIVYWQPEQGTEAPRTAVTANVALVANELTASSVSTANEVSPKTNFPKRKRRGEVSVHCCYSFVVMFIIDCY